MSCDAEPTKEELEKAAKTPWPPPEDLEDVFPPGTPAPKCYNCGNRKIYKNDSVGPICKKCAYGWPDPVKIEPKVGRNTPCTCGSGKKYKKCCGSAIGDVDLPK